MCMHACMHVCNCVCEHARVRACLHAHVHVCLSECGCKSQCMYAGMCMHKRCIPLVKVSATGHCHPLDKYHSLIRGSSAGQNVII